MSSTDTLTRQMHESRARRLIAAETRAAAAEAIRKDLEERLADAEARASLAEDRARDEELKILGNSVVRQQAAAATWAWVCDMRAERAA